MFKIPKINVIESNEVFSIKVEMVKLVYTEGSKTLYINSEIVASPGNIGIWRESIQKWEPPFDHERIDENKREAIVDNIRRAFHWKGETIEVI